MTVLIMGILIALVLAVLIQPIIGGKAQVTSGRGEKRRVVDELRRKKSALIREIKDIELDYQMGKIDKGDFKELTEGYRQQAMLVMREIDSKDGGLSKKKKRSNNSEFVVPENEIAGYCIECGSPLYEVAAFCGICGREI